MARQVPTVEDFQGQHYPRRWAEPMKVLTAGPGRPSPAHWVGDAGSAEADSSDLPALDRHLPVVVGALAGAAKKARVIARAVWNL